MREYSGSISYLTFTCINYLKKCTCFIRRMLIITLYKAYSWHTSFCWRCVQTFHRIWTNGKFVTELYILADVFFFCIILIVRLIQVNICVYQCQHRHARFMTIWCLHTSSSAQIAWLAEIVNFILTWLSRWRKSSVKKNWVLVIRNGYPLKLLYYFVFLCSHKNCLTKERT